MEPSTLSTVFVDEQGDTWDLKLSLGTIEDIKESASVNLDDMLKDPDKLADILLQTPSKLVAMLWVVCEDQAKARNLTPQQFGKRFTRDVIDRAADSFLMAMVLFYPRASAGRALADKLPQLIKDMDKAIATGAKATIQKVLSHTATDSPESSAG